MDLSSILVLTSEHAMEESISSSRPLNNLQKQRVCSMDTVKQLKHKNVKSHPSNSNSNQRTLCLTPLSMLLRDSRNARKEHNLRSNNGYLTSRSFIFPSRSL